MTETTDAGNRRWAEILLAARGLRTPIPPLVDSDQSLTIDDGYEIQAQQVRVWESEDQKVVGYKVGLVSAVMQSQMGVGEPDFGHVMDHDIHNGRTIRLDEYLQPLLEAEIGFILGRPLEGPGVTAEDVLRATDQVVPLVELVDSRIADWKLTIVDTVADNASSGGVYLGSNQIPIESIDLLDTACVVEIDGREVTRGEARNVRGHPAEAAAWLVNELGSRGVSMEPGQLILSGSMTGAVPIPQRRCTISVHFSGLETIELIVEPTSTSKETS